MYGAGLASRTPVDGSSSTSDVLHDNEASLPSSEHERKHDVFISYRRQTGKHLAGSNERSLLLCPSLSLFLSMCLYRHNYFTGIVLLNDLCIVNWREGSAAVR